MDFNVEKKETIGSLKETVLNAILAGLKMQIDEPTKKQYLSEMKFSGLFSSLDNYKIYDELQKDDVINVELPSLKLKIKPKIESGIVRTDIGYKIDLFCSNVEDFLSDLAWAPIAGAIPGALKIAFGTIQLSLAIMSLACSAFILPTSLGRDIFSYSLRHVFHGLINIFAGLIEAVPTLGMMIDDTRYSRKDENLINQSHKFFGYKTLEIDPDKECMVCSV
jgi:hypothetical protein